MKTEVSTIFNIKTKQVSNFRPLLGRELMMVTIIAVLGLCNIFVPAKAQTVYGYNNFQSTGSVPNGPIKFNLSTPGTLISIANQNGASIVVGGTWGEGKWYGTTYSSKQFITIDIATGARTVIGTTPVAINGLSYNRADGKMYGVGRVGTNSHLYSINLTTGATTDIGNCGAYGLINLAINTAGVAYSVDITGDVLGTVNLSTGAFTVIGYIGFNAIQAQDMEFDRESGLLYMAAYDGSVGFLALVNTTTGAATNIGVFEGGAEIAGFAIPYNRPCTNPTTAGTIAGAQTICSGGDPAAFTSTTPTGQTGTLEYKWQSSTTDATTEAGFSDISPSETSETFDPPTGLTTTTWYRRLTEVTCETTWLKSNVLEITVQPVSVTTLAAAAITSTTATGNGNITSICGSNATDRGVIWYPYSGTNKTIGGTDVTNVNEPGDFSTGAFTASLTGLSVNTRYNARAHATNTDGTGYGESVDFWTLANAPGKPAIDIPQLTSLNVSIDANSNPAITTYAIFDAFTGKYVQTNGSLGLTAAWQTEALWEVNAGNTAKTVSGLGENTKYVFKIKAKNGNNVETEFSSKDSLFTLAKVPAAPSVNAASATSVNVAINANGNPAATEFAIQETGGSKYVQSDGALGENAVWQTKAVWETNAGNTAKTVTGLSANTQNTFKVKARNGNNVETAFSGTTSLFTLANVPSPPTVINPTATSLDVAVRPNGNSASTLFAIQDSALVSQYVKADGTRGATAVWQTAAVWDTITVTGLSTGVTYYFRVKAKNGNDVETAFGLSAGQNTCSNPTDGGEIGSDQTICEGSSPEKFTNENGPSGHGGTLEYKWQSSTTSDSEDFEDIADSDSAGFVAGPLTETTWFKRLARVTCKADWVDAAESNVVKIIVQHFPEVIITAPADGSKFYTNPITISGTASDTDENLSYVQVKLNSGTWQTATGSDNWTIDFNLAPGKNTILARAVDSTFLYSDTATIKVLLSIQIINIPQGWSAISSYLTPLNPVLPVMMNEITSTNNLVLQITQYGIYWPSQNYNTIGTWNVASGYKVKMNNAQEFTVRGDTLTNRSISLGSGYQVVPVLSNISCLIDSVFDNPETDIMFLYDVKTSALYWPDGGISTLTTLDPGKGYIAKFNNPVTLTYPAYSGLKSGMMDDFSDPLLGSPWPIVRTADAHFVSIRNEAGNNLENVDFIGAFDSFGNCIGYTGIDGSSGRYQLTLFGEDETTVAKDGAAQSEPISFRSYSSSTNQETELIPLFNTAFPNADGLFASNGQSEIIGFKASATGINESGFAGNIQVYPNPAKDVVNINLSGFQNLTGFNASLISAEGKVVKTFTLTGNQTQLNVQDLQPGVYILRFENAENVVVKRLVIQ